MPPEYQHPFVVQRAGFRPGKCIVTGDIDGPFLDCGIKYEKDGYWNRLYLHLPWVEQVARDHCGMVPRSEVTDLQNRVEAAERKLEALVTDSKALAEAERVIEEVAA